MSSSLLGLLPDILSHAARRSRDAIFALSASSEQHAGGLGHPLSVAKSRSVTFAAGASSTPQCWAGRDLSVLLDVLAGTVSQPSCKRQVGFVWLAAEHLEDCSEEGNRAGTPIALRKSWPMDQPLSGTKNHLILSHLALRLFLVRELVAPHALVAVTPVAGLDDCTVFLMEAVLGQRPQWAQLDASVSDAPQVLICRTVPAASESPKESSPQSKKRVNLTDWMRHERAATATHNHGLTALALRPGRLVMGLLNAWEGDWILSHPDPMALAVLQEQVRQQAWAGQLSTAVTVQEPLSYWPTAAIRAAGSAEYALPS